MTPVEFGFRRSLSPPDDPRSLLSATSDLRPLTSDLAAICFMELVLLIRSPKVHQDKNEQKVNVGRLKCKTRKMSTHFSGARAKCSAGDVARWRAAAGGLPAAARPAASFP